MVALGLKMPNAKPWYTSKTVWFNILTVGGAVAGGVVGLLPALQLVVPPAVYAITLFTVGVVNVLLRSITQDAIWYVDRDTS